MFGPCKRCAKGSSSELDAQRLRLHDHGVCATYDPLQDEGTTNTEEGRARLVVAVQAARKALGHKMVSDADLRVLLFGSDRPGAGL
jgi:hypothetical protein